MAKTIREIMQTIATADIDKTPPTAQAETPLGPREGWEGLHKALTGENRIGPKPGNNAP